MTSNKIDNIVADTHVTFPQGSVKEVSTVVWAGTCSLPGDMDINRGIVISETTPFHPLDHTWPDQPGDTGVIEINDRRLLVADSITAAVAREDKALFFGRSIPARRGDPDWSFVVAHILEEGSEEDISSVIGANAILQVDENRRRLLSASHTSCHVMALALNTAIKGLWHKDVPLDSLGNPNFDQLAIEESRITTEASFDRYRVGKSLRKKGIDTNALLADLSPVSDNVNRILREWLEISSPVTIEAPIGNLSEVRIWKCALKVGMASLPCGGTHLRNLQELNAIEVSIDTSPEDPEFTVRTTPSIKSPSAS